MRMEFEYERLEGFCLRNRKPQKIIYRKSQLMTNVVMSLRNVGFIPHNRRTIQAIPQGIFPPEQGIRLYAKTYPNDTSNGKMPASPL